MPTCLRGQGTALANIMSMVAQIASPYIVYSANINPDLPFYIMGFLGLAGALPGLFLPETAGTNLPDTLDEAKVYGTKDKFFWIPLMNAEERYKEPKDVETPKAKLSLAKLAAFNNAKPVEKEVEISRIGSIV